MKVLHLVENLDDRYGGPAKSVPWLAENLRKLGVTNILFSVKVFNHEENSVVVKSNLDWRSYDLGFFAKFRYAPALRSAVISEITPDTIIHVHTLWTYPALLGHRLALKYDLPLIVSTRGMLYPWSLRQSRWIKKIALTLFQKSMLADSDAIHITEPSELDLFFDVASRNKTHCVPNGMDISEFSDLPDKNTAKTKLGLNLESRQILFMSRIHPKKGLDELLECWVGLADEYSQWDILIVGPVEDERYFLNLKNKVSKFNLKNRVKFTGMLKGDLRIAAFASSDLFVLPTFGENFGIVILEALGCGLPVITTTGAPWREIVELDAGWWIDLESNELYLALKTALAMSDKELLGMGERGKVIAERYAWSIQAKKMLSVYGKITK